MAAFEAEPDIDRAVRAFLTVSAEGNTTEGHYRGCLIACCAPTAAETDLPTSLAPGERAALMIDFMNTQAIRARAGATRSDLMEGIDTRVRAVLADQF